MVLISILIHQKQMSPHLTRHSTQFCPNVIDFCSPFQAIFQISNHFSNLTNHRPKIFGCQQKFTQLFIQLGKIKSPLGCFKCPWLEFPIDHRQPHNICHEPSHCNWKLLRPCRQQHILRESFPVVGSFANLLPPRLYHVPPTGNLQHRLHIHLHGHWPAAATALGHRPSQDVHWHVWRR